MAQANRNAREAEKKRKQIQAQHKAIYGRPMDQRMKGFTDTILEDAERMYQAGRTMKAQGIELLDITQFMKECDLEHGEDNPGPFDMHMKVVRTLYEAYEDGYRGVKR